MRTLTASIMTLGLALAGCGDDKKGLFNPDSLESKLRTNFESQLERTTGGTESITKIKCDTVGSSKFICVVNTNRGGSEDFTLTLKVDEDGKGYTPISYQRG